MPDPASPLTLFTGAGLGRYGFGAGHPFGTDRLDAFWREAVRRGLDRRAEMAAPVLASEEQLATFHHQSYVRRARMQSQAGFGYLDHGDTPAVPGIFDAARYVVGSTLAGVARVLAGDSQRVFVPIAGLHHARRGRAGGFCVFNDIGVVIEALKRHGVRRIAYIDIDAHHGDGVYYEFEEDPAVTIADIHEDGRTLYPGTGAREEGGRGAGAGNKLNLPLPAGAGDREFARAWGEAEDLIRASNPEIILLQAGADSISGDPLTHLELTPASHRLVAERLVRIAEDCAQGRLIVTGGGGYNRDNLAETWCAVVEALLTG